MYLSVLNINKCMNIIKKLVLIVCMIGTSLQAVEEFLKDADFGPTIIKHIQCTDAHIKDIVALFKAWIPEVPGKKTRADMFKAIFRELRVVPQCAGQIAVAIARYAPELIATKNPCVYDPEILVRYAQELDKAKPKSGWEPVIVNIQKALEAVQRSLNLASSLVAAISQNDLEHVQLLLAGGASVNACTRFYDDGLSKQKQAPPLYAINKQTSPDIVRALLEAGANPTIEVDGELPVVNYIKLMGIYLIRKPFPSSAMQTQIAQIVRLLIENTDLSTYKDPYYLLIFASEIATKLHDSSILNLVLDHKANPNAVSSEDSKMTVFQEFIKNAEQTQHRMTVTKSELIRERSQQWLQQLQQAIEIMRRYGGHE